MSIVVSVARFRILVVEDHDFMRRSMVAALERDPHLSVCGEVDSVSSALEAIAALRPDLVLTDLELRESSGLDLIRVLRQGPNTIPVVATTVFDLHRNERAARAAGACAFVPKHLGPTRLVEAVLLAAAGTAKQADS